MDRHDWLLSQKQKGKLRQLTPVKRLSEGQLVLPEQGGQRLLDFSSNDYLALSVHPHLLEKSRSFMEMAGTGAGAARLMSGDLAMYHELEQAVARLKGQEAALLFGSGYMANCGVIPALVERGDVIFCDRLNHASIYDGCRLSRAKTVRFAHNDLNHLEELLKKKRGTGEALIVVESLYSMDGDRCPLKELASLKKKYQCLLMVDEAHATGLFGKNGGGLIEEEEVAEHVDIAMGTFGKALGSYGAYVAASQNIINFLINRARSFIFSTGLPPAVIGASLAAVELIGKEPELRRELFAKVEIFKTALSQGRLNDLGHSQIVPILIGDSEKTLAIASRLRREGVYVTAVRPPTVPENTARLRFSITRHLDKDALQRAAALLLNTLSR